MNSRRERRRLSWQDGGTPCIKVPEALGSSTAVGQVEIRRHERDWQALWYRAQTALVDRRWEDAVGAFGELVEREDDGEFFFEGASLEMRLGRGVALLEAGRLDEALWSFLTCAMNWPDMLAPAYLTGHVLVLQGEESLADLWFQRLFKRGSWNDRDLFDFLLEIRYGQVATVVRWLENMPAGLDRDRARAFFLAREGRFEDAIAASKDMRRWDPSSPLSHAFLGVLYAQTPGRSAEAIQWLEDAASAGEPSSRLYLLVSYGYDLLGDFKTMETYCHKSLALEPDLDLALGSLADALHCQRRYEDARVVLLKMVEEGKGRNPHSLLGLGYSNQSRYEEAEPWLEQAVERMPRGHTPLSHLGLLRHKQGRLKEAETLYRKAMEVDPHWQMARMRLGRLLFDMAEYGESLFHLSYAQVHRRFLLPLEGPCHRALKTILRSMPELESPAELDELITVFENLIEHREREPTLLETLALVLLRAPTKADPQRALELAREAVEKRGRRPDFLATLAVAQHASGDLPGAVATLEEACESEKATDETRQQLDEYREELRPRD